VDKSKEEGTMSKTESYIILKPIAERFNKISASITDAEIKQLIKDELRDQMKKISFGGTIDAIVSAYIEDHEEDILELAKISIKERMLRI
jgi:iron-sulfur cluster repair protein YtfE (RIC family)